MDADYIGTMDNEEVRLKPIEDYEAQTGNAYRPRNMSDSFEPLEVSMRGWYSCTSPVLTDYCYREMIQVTR